MKKATLIALTLWLGLIFGTPAFANASNTFPFGLTKDQLIKDFIHIAISPKAFAALDDEQLSLFREMVRGAQREREEYKKRYLHNYKGELVKVPGGYPAYFDEYLLRQKGMPDSHKITKWNKPVVIGLASYAVEDLLRNKTGHFLGDPLPVEEAKKVLLQRNSFGLNPYLIADDQVKSLLPELRKATGLDISYAPGDLSERVNVTIALNITGMSGAGATYFKWSDNVRPNPFSVFRNLRGKIMFTPDLDAQVGGFLLLDAHGAIDRVVCQIYPYLNSDLIRSLVSECLVRAMGLPIQSVSDDTALVGQWNVAQEGKAPPVLSEKCEAESGKRSKECAASTVFFGGEGSNPDSFHKAYGMLASRTDYSRLTFNLTGYDKWLLETLYHPELKIGMSQEQAREVVSQVVSKSLAAKEN